MNHSLRLQDLSLQVRLGCTDTERADSQEVRIGFSLRFHDSPHAVESDCLRDTICYAKLSDAFREHLASREFNLVEKIAGDLLGIAQKIVEGRALVALSVHKVKPPVDGLVGGVEYRIGDWA